MDARRATLFDALDQDRKEVGMNDRKPKHVPNVQVSDWREPGIEEGCIVVKVPWVTMRVLFCSAARPQCRGGWTAVGVADKTVLFVDVPILLHHRWEGQ